MAVKPNSALAASKTKKEAKKEEMVYATKRGKKYHKAECRFIKNRETAAMSIEESKEKGLEPCGRCFTEEE